MAAKPAARAVPYPVHGWNPSPCPTTPDGCNGGWSLPGSRRRKHGELLQDYLDADAQAAILNQLGRNCAGSFGRAEQYIGNPDGFFRYMKDSCGEEIAYDRDAQTITVISPERDCVCLLVNSAGHFSRVLQLFHRLAGIHLRNHPREKGERDGGKGRHSRRPAMRVPRCRIGRRRGKRLNRRP